MSILEALKLLEKIKRDGKLLDPKWYELFLLCQKGRFTPSEIEPECLKMHSGNLACPPRFNYIWHRARGKNLHSKNRSTSLKNVAVTWFQILTYSQTIYNLLRVSIFENFQNWFSIAKKFSWNTSTLMDHMVILRMLLSRTAIRATVVVLRILITIRKNYFILILNLSTR